MFLANMVLNNMLHIKLIVGSTRRGRFSEHLVPWIESTVGTNERVALETLDLRDYPMPFYDQPGSPAGVSDGQYPNEIVRAWAAKIAEADAVIVITPEYNRSISAVLKNAIDSIYREWNNKPLGIVTYGSIGGARAAEQFRLIAIELQMAPIRSAVHIQAPWGLRDEQGALKDGALDDYMQFSKKMIIERILCENQIPGEQLLSFGDGYVEIQNTKEVGGLAVAVASDEAHNGSGRMDEWKRQRLLGVGADMVIPDYRDAVPLLDMIFSR